MDFSASKHPVQLWRICRARYAHAAYTGEGSSLYAARWNFAGTRMVYTAPSLALAALETFVHLNEEPPDLVSASAMLPLGLEIETLDLRILPPDWMELDQDSTRKIGSGWIASGRSVALKVPSVVVPGERNVLLNPAHPDFRRITLHPPEAWHFDPRMFRPRP